MASGHVPRSQVNLFCDFYHSRPVSAKHNQSCITKTIEIRHATSRYSNPKAVNIFRLSRVKMVFRWGRAAKLTAEKRRITTINRSLPERLSHTKTFCKHSPPHLQATLLSTSQKRYEKNMKQPWYQGSRSADRLPLSIAITRLLTQA